MACFFCERRGFSRDAVLSPSGPVAALLAGTRAHLQQPKQLLLGRLVGLAPSGGSVRSHSLQRPEAWHFFVRLLCCLRALQGAGWDALAKVSWLGLWACRVPYLCLVHCSRATAEVDRAPFWCCRSGRRARRVCRCRCPA